MSHSNLQIQTILYSDHAELASISSQWHALTLNVLEQNINYDPIPLLGLLNGEPYIGWCVVTFWSGDELIGLFPIQRVKGFKVPIEQYTSVFANYFLKAVPLVHKERANEVVRAYVNWINQGKPKIIVFNESMEGSQYRSILLETLRTEKMIVQNVDSSDRAIVKDATQTYSNYLLTAFKAKSRSTLKRKIKRLHAAGEYKVEFYTGDDPDRIKKLVDDVIAVEAKSWKMENGSAVACRPYVIKFAHDTAQYAAKHDRLLLAVSYLDGVAIGCYYGMVNDGGVGCWKIGYDEAYSDYSPGLVLMLEVVEYCLDSGKYTNIDSYASPDASMFNRALQQRLGLEKYRMASKHMTASVFLQVIYVVKRCLQRFKSTLRSAKQ